jgi:chromosome segregation ATPase
MMEAVVGLDPAAAGALAALLISTVAAVAGARYGGRKTNAETESIATRTTLEVNEALRDELADNRKEAAELRRKLRERDEELDALQRRFARLRLDFDALEVELETLKRKAGDSSAGRVSL